MPLLKEIAMVSDVLYITPRRGVIRNNVQVSFHLHSPVL